MDTGDKIATRLFIDAADGTALVSGGSLDLGADAAHQLRAVLRCSPGDLLAVVHPDGGEWLARIEALGKAKCTVSLVAQRRPPAPEPGPWLFFAPLKRDAVDWLVQKATELGASRLQPIITRRTVVERVNLDRLQAIAREAAEQSERLTRPEVVAPIALDRLPDLWPALGGGRPLLIACEWGDAQRTARPLPQVLTGLTTSGPLPAPPAFLTGPEGGLVRSEVTPLLDLPNTFAVTLGPRILRAASAALAGLTLVQSMTGDWTEAPRWSKDADKV